MKRLIAVVCAAAVLFVVSVFTCRETLGEPVGTSLTVLTETPAAEAIISTGLTGSSYYASAGYGPDMFTDEQKEDIAKISYGISAIGVSALERQIKTAADGVWAKSAGAFAWYTIVDSDSGVNVKYNVNGETGQEDSRYMTMLTYNFGQKMNFSAFSFMATSLNGFPQAADVYVSDDGTAWTLAGAYDRCALRVSGADLTSVTCLNDSNGAAASMMVAWSLTGYSGQYIRFAFTKGNGSNTGGSYDGYANPDDNTKSNSFRELAVFGTAADDEETEAETLYNGITLPDVWPPNDISSLTAEPMDIPYLRSISDGGTRPDVIDITVGRQLFVDDFLIDSTTLTTEYHTPEKYEGNPILYPQTDIEINATQAGAAPKSGGVWYDMDEKIYKMWYEAGWNNRLAYAVSADGINWVRPAVNSDGTNIVLPDQQTDSTTAYIDYDAPVTERYKLMVRSPGSSLAPAAIYTSPDGVNWVNAGETQDMGDRSTFFYNPFRKKWVLSIRDSASVLYPYNGELKTFTGQRARYYAESDDFLSGWQDSTRVFWQKADGNDPIDADLGQIPQLYNFDAVGYESIMFGMFQIWRGPDNNTCSEGQFPKTTELMATYSRDGFYFDRPDRNNFISATREAGTWDRGYVQSVGGGMIIKEDQLWFYYIGFRGEFEDQKGMHVGSSTHLAILRRDGFASLSGAGEMVTRPLTVTGNKKYLFVNVNAPEGRLSAEVIDQNGAVVSGYSLDDCIAVGGDTTKSMITWRNSSDLSFLNDSQFQLRFKLTSGEFYSFWLSDSETGDSNGMTAAGLVEEDNDEQLTYAIEPIPSLSLSILSAGYASGAQETKSIAITNAGSGNLTNLATTISGTDVDKFSVSQPADTILPSSSVTDFTVMAKDGLEAGTYTATVTITADNLSPVSFKITQQVNAVDLATVTTPVISPSAGTYNSQWVTLTCATDGAMIRYTMDGSDPTSSSALYSGAISLPTGTSTVKAKAFLDGYNASAIASAAYTISGTVNTYQTGNGSTTLTLKTAQNFEGDLTVQYDTASLWVGKGKTGKLSNLWLDYPDLIGSGDGQIPSGSGIVSAQLVLTVKGFDGNPYLAHKMNLYQITDPENLGAPYFGSDGVANGLDYLYRDHRMGRNVPWKTGATNISSLLAENDPVDTYELIPASFAAEGYTRIRLDVTDSVQAWAKGSSNQGWFLTGAAASAWAYDDGIEFYGITATTVANRPKLEVSYVSAGSDYTAPDAVTSLTSIAGDGQVDLAWTNPSGFAGVTVLRKAGVIPADPTDGTVIYDGVDSSYTDTGLTNDKTYYYAVFTYDTLRNYSKKVWTKAIPTAGSGTPAAPSGLAVSQSGSEITFSWTDNSTNESYFQLEQQKGSDGSWLTVACPAAGEQSLTTAITDPNFDLAPSTAYNYRISAVNDNGSSDYATCSWTMSAFLQAPTDVTWTIVSTGKVNLTWTNAATDATAIRVDLYSVDTDTALSSISLAANATSCAVTGLQAGTEYLIKVVAIRGTEEAAASTEVIKTTADSKGGLL